MHEMSIVVELMGQLEALAAEHGAEKIDEVIVQTGAMRAIVPEAMHLAFEAATKGACAEGAVLKLEIAPALARCRNCGRQFAPDIDCFLCPRCNKADVEIIEGNDIILKSVTFERKQAASHGED